MSLNQLAPLTDELGKASVQQGSTDLIVTEQALDTVESSRPSHATLLAIPGELRNRIFDYLYSPLDATGYQVDINFHVQRAVGTFATIPISQAPPSKDPILVCRQLYNEFKDMQAAAFRQYWSTNTFSAKRADFPPPSGNHVAVEDRDLKHAHHFIVATKCEGFQVPVAIKFAAGKWNAFFEVPEDLWDVVCYLDPLTARAAPHTLQCLDDFELMMHREMTCTHEWGCACSKIMDPKHGLGLAARHVFVAQFSIEDGFEDSKRNWATVT